MYSILHIRTYDTIVKTNYLKRLTKEHLDDVDWLPADRTVVQWVREYEFD